MTSVLWMYSMPPRVFLTPTLAMCSSFIFMLRSRALMRSSSLASASSQYTGSSAAAELPDAPSSAPSSSGAFSFFSASRPMPSIFRFRVCTGWRIHTRPLGCRPVSQSSSNRWARPESASLP